MRTYFLAAIVLIALAVSLRLDRFLSSATLDVFTFDPALDANSHDQDNDRHDFSLHHFIIVPSSTSHAALCEVR
jgi:hypothetical protein